LHRRTTLIEEEIYTRYVKFILQSLGFCAIREFCLLAAAAMKDLE